MEKVVFTNGCFDLLHEGHKYLLTKAAKYGILVVGLNSDSSVRRLKGPDRPIWDQDKRRLKLYELDCVHAVLLFYDDTPIELVNLIKPDIIVKGSDYGVEDVVGSNIVSEVILVPMLPEYSTTKIIMESSYEIQNGFKKLGP